MTTHSESSEEDTSKECVRTELVEFRVMKIENIFETTSSSRYRVVLKVNVKSRSKVYEVT